MGINYFKKTAAGKRAGAAGVGSLSGRMITAVLVLIMAAGLLAGCEKEGGSTATGTAAKTGAATGSAAKTSAVSTAAKTTAKSSSTGSAAGTAAASAGAQATAGTGTGEEADVTDENGGDTQASDGSVNEEASFDLGGRQVRMIGWQKIDLEDGPNVDAYTRAVFNNIRAAETKYNFKMEIDQSYCMTANLYHAKIMSLLMAGINPADLFNLQNADVQAYNFIKNKLVVCLSDYLDFESDLYLKNNPWRPTTEFNGKVYGLYRNVYTGNNGILYNAAILAQEGLEDVWDLFAENRWNWQTMLDYSIKATKDLNGDGIIDQWGCTIYNNSTFITYLLNSNGLPAVGQVDGKMISNYDTLAGKRALQFGVDLTYVYKVVGGNTLTYRKGQALFMWGPFYENANPIKAGLTTSLVGPLPAGPDRPETLSIKAAGSWFYVSALSDIPKEASQILRDVMVVWTEDGKHPNADLVAAEHTGLNPWDEGYNPRWYMTERDAVNSSRCVYPIVAEWSTLTGTGAIAGNIANDLMKGEPVATAVAKYIEQINSMLDNFN